MLVELRQKLRKLERPAGFEAEAGAMPLGIAAIDTALGGGLARGALHEIAAAGESHIAAATGFAFGVSRGAGAGIWIAEDMTRIENGAPCGPGLEEFGFAPERLITVSAAHNRDFMWAMEEALRCRVVGVVIGETRRAQADPIALRRLSLAASTTGALTILLRTAPAPAASTAATRWIVAAARSLPRYGPGPARMKAQLVRNRRGALGSWLLEWSDTDERFVLASTHPQPVAMPALDRPARAAVA